MPRYDNAAYRSLGSFRRRRVDARLAAIELLRVFLAGPDVK